MAIVRFGMVSWDGTKYAPIAGGSITVQGLGTFPADNAAYDAGLGGTPHTLPPGTYAFTANPPSGYSLGNYATAAYSIPQPEIWMSIPFFGMGGVSWPSGGRDGDNPFYISATNTNPTQITIMDSGNFLPNVQWYVPFNGNVWVFLTPGAGTPPPTPSPPSVGKSLSATLTVTAGVPVPSASLTPYVDNIANQPINLPSTQITLGQAHTQTWMLQMPAGSHTIHVHLHLENSLGQYDVDSNMVTVQA